jgi:SAM-dependent methyltransferase
MVVQAVRSINEPIQSMLLAGESGSAKPIYASIADIAPDRITTAGLHEDADSAWNFEEAPPELGQFQCIVSHAILEHLIEPYRHVRDLANLLQPGGHLVVFTVTPGFPYHRHPVDCFRFFPDWFETVAERLELEIHDRFYGDERIMYHFRRP